MESNSVWNHTSDNKIGRPRSGSPICSSRVWLEAELDDTKSYYQLLKKITIFEKRIAKLWKKEKIRIKIPTKEMKNLLPVISAKNTKASARTHARTSLHLWMWLVDFNYSFECDWPIELSENKVSNNKLSDNNLASELVGE